MVVRAFEVDGEYPSEPDEAVEWLEYPVVDDDCAYGPPARWMVEFDNHGEVCASSPSGDWYGESELRARWGEFAIDGLREEIARMFDADNESAYDRWVDAMEHNGEAGEDR